MHVAARLIVVAVCARALAGALAFELLQPAGSLTWSYNDKGLGLDAVNWASRTYNDSAWSRSAGRMGYGIGGETTVLQYGSSAASKHPTYYFRTKVTVPVAPSTVTAAVIGLLATHGGVVYVNGDEVARFNMGPQARVKYTDFALAAVAAPSLTTMEYYSFDPRTVLVQGENVISVEVHQAGASSTTLAFDAYLLLSDEKTVPYLTYAPYAQFQSSSSAIVRWYTSVASDSLLFFSTAEGAPVRSVASSRTDAVLTISHVLTMTGLPAGAALSYRYVMLP
jgi:hypothetical protein